MSWLFDRLCEIAVADRVEVVIAAQPAPSDIGDLAEVLARVALVPQVDATVLPAGCVPVSPLGPALRFVDLDELPPGATAMAVERLVRDALDQADAVRLRGSLLELRPTDRSPGTTAALADPLVSVVVATDLPTTGEVLRAVERRGLAIAVGGVDPDAQVKMDTFTGVVSIVDALVTLRGFAFGGDQQSSLAAADPAMMRRIA
ncbi:MAG: hypothetical protein R2713_09850 [Ilumatobacteraceae bacterium]